MWLLESLAVLESFARSAEAKSFSAAARQLGLSPAAVSKNVAKLEASLGVRLFARSTRSLRLTEPGEAFYRELAGGLGTVRAAIANARGAPDAPAGTLKVSLSPAFGRDYVLPIIGELLRKHPAVTLDWHFDNRQIDLVAEGFDAAIGAAIDLSAGVIARELARAHMLLVASPAYLKKHPAPSKPSELSTHDGIVLRSPQSGRVRSWPFRNARGDSEAFELRTRMAFTDTDAITEAALLGYGIGVVSMPHALPHLERGTLVRVLPKWHADAGPISLYFSAQKHLPAKTRAFVDHVVASFGERRLAKRLRAD